MAKVDINIKFVEIDHTKIDKYIVNNEITFAPVLNADWEEGYDGAYNGTFKCSNCGELHSKANYCPNCGSKMR